MTQPPLPYTLDSLRAFYAGLGLAPEDGDLAAALAAINALMQNAASLDEITPLEEDPGAAFLPWAPDAPEP